MAFCEQCGAKLSPGAQFCEECGARIEDDVSGQKSSVGVSVPRLGANEDSTRRSEGSDADIDVFSGTGQECILRSVLRKNPTFRIEVKFQADYQKATPVELNIKWSSGDVASVADGDVVAKVQLAGFGNIADLKIKTDEACGKCIELGCWSFSSGMSEKYIDYEKLEDLVAKSLEIDL